MPKASSAKPVTGRRAAVSASTKKTVYADVLEAKTRRQTQAVQAALRSAQAGKLLFRKG